MKIINFVPQHAIQQFHSQHASAMHITSTALHVVVIRLEAGGVLGYHQAATNQLFVVIEGQGWVCGENRDDRQPIRHGQAAFWAGGEWHETITEHGLTALVLEGESLVI
ncbi:MAG: cupin [Chloroflexi bacterium]|nr:cupin [Chloroflexota bacterium]